MNDILERIVPQTDVADLHDKVDEQSAQLVYEVYRYFNSKLNLPDNEAAALNRLLACVQNRDSWDSGLQRNNIFKAANLLGMDLPSASF